MANKAEKFIARMSDEFYVAMTEEKAIVDCGGQSWHYVQFEKWMEENPNRMEYVWNQIKSKFKNPPPEYREAFIKFAEKDWHHLYIKEVMSK